jgi:hypothetical protein
MDQKSLPMTSMPITVYKVEIGKGEITEWHELWTARRPETDEFILCQRHGWWDEPNKMPRYNVPVLSEPHKTDQAATLAMRDQLERLAKQGWVHQYTLAFDPTTGGGKGVKLTKPFDIS